MALANLQPLFALQSAKQQESFSTESLLVIFILKQWNVWDMPNLLS